jgi:hypothetical protein
MVERRPHLLNMGSMNPDSLMQLLARHPKLFRPVVNIGRHLRIDLLRIMRTLLRLYMLRVWRPSFRLLNFFMFMRPCRIWMRHRFIPLFAFPQLDARIPTRAGHASK